MAVRSCPFCRVAIQKDGGCNHMTCTQCHGEFCWVCLQAWSPLHQCSSAALSYTRNRASWSIFQVPRKALLMPGEMGGVLDWKAQDPRGGGVEHPW